MKIIRTLSAHAIPLHQDRRVVEVCLYLGQDFLFTLQERERNLVPRHHTAKNNKNSIKVKLKKRYKTDDVASPGTIIDKQSILSTFYVHILRMKFWRQNLCKKCVHKMLMKLTPRYREFEKIEKWNLMCQRL